jgi:amidohydrolase
LSFEERKTSEYIAARLKEWGIPHQSGVAKTGVVALLEGRSPQGRTVALRADMDALPITELNDVPYKSTASGKMHACGHDVHMASLLGSALILKELRSAFTGRVKLIFQPSEERYPGGARLMIEEGVLDDPRPDVILGQHVYPDLDAGTVGLRPGPYMASTDELYLTVKGKGGHGATPDKVIDPVVIASHIVVALQTIVSRQAKPSIPSLISFGRVVADGQTNVIPDEVKMEGIMRTFDEGWRAEMKERIVRMAGMIAGSMGGSCDVFIDPGYPILINDEKVSEEVTRHASEYLGDEHVTRLEMRTTAEDFAYYLQRIPGCFYRLGVRNTEKGFTSNLHSATFDVDESSLETGMGLMAWLTIMQLQQT